MDPKSDNKTAGFERTGAEAPQVRLSAEQASLVQGKMVALRKARDLQAELAGVRAELTGIDQRMLDAGFHLPALACW